MKYKVIDLFAGAGGFGLGFHLVDFKIILSLEKDDWAIKTLRTNRLGSQKIIHEDIKKITDEKAIKNLCSINPHVIIGGPPCQGFSIAGILSRKGADTRNNLFRYFAKWVKHLNPKVFVIENVKGILSWKDKNGNKIIDKIINTFNTLGYKVEVWSLNAAEYGVPQNRERVFIVGNNINLTLGPPPKTHYLINNKSNSINISKRKKLKKVISVWQALSDLPLINAGEGEEKQNYNKNAKSKYQKWARQDSSMLYNHVAMNHTKRLIKRFHEMQNGNLLANIHDDFKVKKRNGNGALSEIEFHSNYRHLKKNNMSFTIPAHFYSSFIHPTKPRNITAREAARLQSFPDFYTFKGKRTVVSSKLLKRLGKHEENYLSQYNQIGNAVPPLLAQAIALHIKTFLNSNRS